MPSGITAQDQGLTKRPISVLLSSVAIGTSPQRTNGTDRIMSRRARFALPLEQWFFARLSGRRSTSRLVLIV